MRYLYRCDCCSRDTLRDFPMSEPVPETITDFCSPMVHLTETDEDTTSYAGVVTQLRRVWEPPMMNLGTTALTNDIDRFRFKNL